MRIARRRPCGSRKPRGLLDDLASRPTFGLTGDGSVVNVLQLVILASHRAGAQGLFKLFFGRH